MRRPPTLLVPVLAMVGALLVLSLAATACSDDAPTRRTEGFPSPAPAPTLAGEVVELPVPEVRAEAVLVGIESTATVPLRALPGADQPLAGEISPGEGIVVLGQAFQTEDGLIWWQIDGGAVQGWMSRDNIAFRGTPTVTTDAALTLFDSTGTFDGPEAAARALAEAVATDRGVSDVVVVSTARIEDPVSATVTVDLLGLEDDSLRGIRLLVASAEANGWMPVSVVEAPLCALGVSPTGLCL